MTEETNQILAEADKPAEQNPTRGGSYVRKDDGSLEQVEGTKPASPKTATEPQAPTSEE